jgi:hypothetical protein
MEALDQLTQLVRVDGYLIDQRDYRVKKVADLARTCFEKLNGVGF